MMKIEEIETVSVEYITMDSGYYRRVTADCWERLYGESWEACYSEEKELEREYQEYNNNKRNNRIKELALLAGLEYDVFLPDAWTCTDGDLVRFANLIIKEYKVQIDS